MITFLKVWWKPLALLAVLALLVAGARIAWVKHGQAQYDAGYAKRGEDQVAADKLTRKQREEENARNEREAQNRIDQARNDAMLAAQRAGGLRNQLDTIRQQLREYSTANGFGSSAGDTGVLLADLLSKSVERNRQLADYADRATTAGAICERQYDSLTKRGTSPR
ncbi:putative phage tail protein [Pseudescherichia vulneris NBRC 102420]|uniref:Putative phage tail protein n=1 Tax=Pseudescherichia vulneris NBRC 102420 TaxID=1115515 RepID=A0A090UXC5_PSEVU|nr:DUF2514 domain-containing protein [Pseudescherichia vulneris]GAL57181.1 putative phage tail protein [Pseudescherichia vulneris NBRC 102420]STN93586.1 putative phage lysis accessory protein [Pseudescherichia vulneris]STQ60967.1 putative phage lysis accessory protein [Pseudescherichia vulneris]